MSFSDFSVKDVSESKEYILFKICNNLACEEVKVKKENIPNLLVKMIKSDSYVAIYNKEVLEAVIKNALKYINLCNSVAFHF